MMNLMLTTQTVTDLAGWASAVQAAVTAIRGAGASSQMILLPGNGYTGASTFVSGGSAAALAGVTNPDKSTTNLIFDVHQYLDSDGSGTSTSCVKKSDVLAPLLTWLQDSKRQALLSETGGGSSDQSCITNVCDVIDFLNTNSDQFLGYVGWAAGSFASSYVLSLVPDGDTDVPLMAQCFAGKFGGGAGTSPAAPVSSSGAAPVSSSAPAPSSAGSSPVSPVSSSAPAPSSAGGSGGASPVSSSPATLATSTKTSSPSGTAPVLSLPSHTGVLYHGSGSGTGTGIGSSANKQQMPQQPGGPSNPNEQDDCEAEWEDVPAPQLLKARNGKVRWSYEGEVEEYKTEV